MRVAIIILIMLCSSVVFSQDSLRQKLIGTWDLYQSLDTLDTTLQHPYNFLRLEANGQCEEAGYICDDKPVRALTVWKFEKGSIYIAAYQAACFTSPANGHYGIRFLTDDLFYTKSVSHVENDSKPIYDIFKRRK